MGNHSDEHLQRYHEEHRPIPRWIAMVYVLLIVGGLTLAYLAYQRWLA